MGLENLKVMVTSDFEAIYTKLPADEIAGAITQNYINPAEEKGIDVYAITGDTQGLHAYTDRSNGFLYSELNEEQKDALEAAVNHNLNILTPFAKTGKKVITLPGNHDSKLAYEIAVEMLRDEEDGYGYTNVINTLRNPYDEETNTLAIPGAQIHEVDEEVSHLCGPNSYNFVNNPEIDKYVFIKNGLVNINLAYISERFGNKINSDTIAFSHEPIKGVGENSPDYLSNIRILPNYGDVPSHDEIYFDLATYTLKTIADKDKNILKQSGNEQSIAIKEYLKANENWIEQILPLIFDEKPSSVLNFLKQNFNVQVSSSQLEQLITSNEGRTAIMKSFNELYSSKMSEETGVPFVSGGNAGSSGLKRFYDELGINYSFAGHLSFVKEKRGINDKGEIVKPNKASKSLSAIIGSADNGFGAVVERSSKGVSFTPIQNGEELQFDEDPEKPKTNTSKETPKKSKSSKKEEEKTSKPGF